MGTAQVNIQTVYAPNTCPTARRARWSGRRCKGVGNALVGGSWKSRPRSTRRRSRLEIKGAINVPLPGLMKMVVAPVVKGEFEKLVEKYIDNLIKRFGGEA